MLGDVIQIAFLLIGVYIAYLIFGGYMLIGSAILLFCLHFIFKKG